MMRARCFVWSFFIAGLGAQALEEWGGDDTLRVGVTHRPLECQRRAQKGDRIALHYTGSLLEDRSVFDSSVSRGGEPFYFTVGAGQVIKGLDQGVMGSCVGETRKLVLGSNMGYGSRGAGPEVPPGSALIFDVETVALEAT